MHKVFYGALVSPRTLSEHTVSPSAVLCVSHAGTIEWVEHDVHSSALQDVLAKHGLYFHDVEFTELKHGEFLMPGFIDTHLVSLLLHHSIADV